MKLSQFNFELSEKQIAPYPTINRDESRLMILHKKSGEIEHKIFKDIINYMDEKDLVVFNNTKVFPARLKGTKEKTQAEIIVSLLREINPDQRLWDVLVDPARKIRIGNKLYFGEGETLVAEVIDNTTSRGRTLRFLFDGPYPDFKKTLFNLGEIPLPNWVRKTVEPIDTERYQTLFAEVEGAVAAPAAGLHFSRELLLRMKIKGVDSTNITLHMGIGYFRNVDVEDLSKHKMDSEPVVISEETANLINQTRKQGHKVFATGVTVLRALETPVTTKKEITPFEGWTNKFIFPPYECVIPNCLITNFHRPQSTMLMFTTAFGGYDTVMDAYQVAIKEGYKFGPYGDSMLIMD